MIVKSFSGLSEISKGSGEVGSRRVPARALFCVAGYHVAVTKVSSQLSLHTGTGMEQNTQIPGLSASLFFPSPSPAPIPAASYPLLSCLALKGTQGMNDKVKIQGPHR